ncbi:hypothetical protein ElyMa_003219000 [Elysia marginata]|uniref:Cadherin domain-containing protein n=1 Tax=Elysia marginata TaxID=1093978 RepID=A0AAV4J1I6_9GAST|nr:hypothetical protein ElyMa_003219000 [Elysia marginata]
MRMEGFAYIKTVAYRNKRWKQRRIVHIWLDRVIKVTDVNEKPEISDEKTSIEVCEGKTEFLPPFTMTDPDEEDTHLWTFVGNSNDEGLYYIHPTTGLLGTNIDYDVDPDYDKPKRYPGKFTYKVREAAITEKAHTE